MHKEAAYGYSGAAFFVRPPASLLPHVNLSIHFYQSQTKIF